MNVRISPLALQDMKFLKAHVSDDLQNPIAAIGMIKKIMKTIKGLPGPINARLSLSDYVGFPCDYQLALCATYIIVYRVSGNDVMVCRVLYSRRDYARKLFASITVDDDLTTI